VRCEGAERLHSSQADQPATLVDQRRQQPGDGEAAFEESSSAGWRAYVQMLANRGEDFT
jgi:hypothetical protein